ncbi:hypothetical protein [Aureimonas endophytica]|nr:hypothetical protein [Aureimonas endophytica]
MIDWRGLFGLSSSRRPRGERRAAPRLRTRLRPGKVLSADHAFLADCAILDRSPAGLRIRCFAPIAAEDGLVRVFDEHEGTVRAGRIVWEHVAEMGVTVEGDLIELDADSLRRLKGPYYAIGD